MDMAAEDSLNVSVALDNFGEPLGANAQSHLVDGVEAGRSRRMVHEQDDRLVSLGESSIEPVQPLLAQLSMAVAFC